MKINSVTRIGCTDGQLPVVQGDGLEDEGATHEEKADQRGSRTRIMAPFQPFSSSDRGTEAKRWSTAVVALESAERARRGWPPFGLREIAVIGQGWKPGRSGSTRTGRSGRAGRMRREAASQHRRTGTRM